MGAILAILANCLAIILANPGVQSAIVAIYRKCTEQTAEDSNAPANLTHDLNADLDDQLQRLSRHPNDLHPRRDAGADPPAGEG